MAVAKQNCIADFTASLRDLGVTPAMRLAVAVSGGVDSIALAHLAWHAHPRDQLIFLTVDHRLRASSTREAEQVAALLRSWGAKCEILTWQDAKGGSGVQQRARTARYDLLRAAARAADCNAVLLGHHADDQAETFWMCLADGSGLSGLGGMTARRDDGGLVWLRPLLNATRSDIAAYAAAQALPVIEDPSNTNAAFTRVRLRGFVEQLEREGLDAQRLGRTMAKLRAADDALQSVTQQFIKTHIKQHIGGALCMTQAGFAALAPDLRRRVMQACLMAMTLRDYPPAYDALVGVAENMAQVGAAAVSLAGCLVMQYRGDIWILREVAATEICTLDTTGDDCAMWDHRFTVSGMRVIGHTDVQLRALGEAGIAILGQEKNKILWPEGFQNAPAALRRTVAALWQGEKLLAVPQLSWKAAGFDAPMPDIRAHISLGDIV